MGLYGGAGGFTVTLKKSSYGYKYLAGSRNISYALNGGSYVEITSLTSDIILTGVLTIQFSAVASSGYEAWIGTTNGGNDILRVISNTPVTSALITLTSDMIYYCELSN